MLKNLISWLLFGAEIVETQSLASEREGVVIQPRQKITCVRVVAGQKYATTMVVYGKPVLPGQMADGTYPRSDVPEEWRPGSAFDPGYPDPWAAPAKEQKKKKKRSKRGRRTSRPRKG